MAKKTTQYTKQRNRILRYINRQKKKSLVTDLYFPTEKELRKQGVKGKELTKLTNELKRLTSKNLKGYFYNPFEEPEIITENDIKPSQIDKRYWTKEDAENHKSQLPDGGETVYENIFEDFISRISALIENTKRNASAIRASEQGKTTLYSLATSIALADGKSVVGWRLYNAEDLDSLITYVLGGSRAELIQTATHRIAEIIKGTPLSRQETRDLADESELNEGWALNE
jgi:hypothetical protein